MTYLLDDQHGPTTTGRPASPAWSAAPGLGQSPAPGSGPGQPPDDPVPATPSRARRAAARALPVVVGAAAMLALILAWSAVQPPPDPLTRSDVADAIASALAEQTPPPSRGEGVFQAVGPSVVLIEVSRPGTGSDPERGEGTGVIVTVAGEILTALHVVDGADTIDLTYADGSTGSAVVTSRDEAKDIAVLAPDSLPAMPPAVLGNPGALRPGSDVFVIGNPFGLYESVSAGIVSATNRSFRNPDTDRIHTGLIQVDAAVNPGNSGGPLVDRDGRVVGIVTSLVNPSGSETFLGIGLAVPIDVAGGGAGLPPY